MGVPLFHLLTRLTKKQVSCIIKIFVKPEMATNPSNGQGALSAATAASAFVGGMAGAAVAWKFMGDQSETPATPENPQVPTAPSSSSVQQVSLHGLKGVTVSHEQEIAPVLDTAEEAGTCHEDLMRFESLIRHNIQQGISVVFGAEYGSGVMGMYDPENNFILIAPETVDMGIEDTMKTLLHETVHAHQDISDGLDNDTMETLGLEINPQGVEAVQENYTELSQDGTLIELESNSAEYNVEETFEELDVEVSSLE